MLTAYRLNIAQTSIEQLSLQKYTRQNRAVPILPYDTAFVSRKQYKQAKSRNAQAFFDSLYLATKSNADSTLFTTYIKQRNDYYELIVEGSLEQINKPYIIEMCRGLHQYEQAFLLPLARKHISDPLLVRYFENEVNFWIARNDHMTRQILQYAEQFAGKRIVILTGLNHKYYLQERLRTQAASTINLTEFENI